MIKIRFFLLFNNLKVLTLLTHSGVTYFSKKIMEKLLLLFSLVFTLMGTASAQQESHPATMMDRMKERINPQVIGKVKLTHNQADKEIEQR
jgi:uncharacterized membrane protein YsdA (DUF1294 family)